MQGAYAISHWFHTLLVVVLAGTGMFIFFPEARSFLFQGYSLIFSEVHRFSGAIYIPVTFLFVGLALNKKPNNQLPRGIKIWKQTHVKLLGITTVAFGISGILMWFSETVPAKIIDLCALFHQLFTFLVLGLLLIHLSLLKVKNNYNNGVKNE